MDRAANEVVTLAAIEAALPMGVAFGRNDKSLTIRFRLGNKDARVTDRQWPIGKPQKNGALNKSQEKLTRDSIVLAETHLRRVNEAIAADRFTWAEFFPESAQAQRERAASPDAVLLSTVFDAFEAELHGQYHGETLRKKLGMLNGWIRPQWADKTVAELTVGAVEEWISAIQRGEILPAMKSDKLSNRPADLKIRRDTMKLILTVLHGAIESTEGRKVFGRANPIKSHIKLQKLWGASNGSRPAHEVIPFTHEEQARINAVATPRQRRMITFWMATGLRISELLALCWSEVDFDRELVRVRYQYKAGERTTELKTKVGSKREVPLSSAALAVLREQKAEVVQHLHGHVWPGVQGQPMTNSSSFHNEWRPLLERAGVAYREPEQCRHTCASRLAKARMPIAEISKLLGHESISTTNDYYHRFIPSADTAHGYSRLPDDSALVSTPAAPSAAA